MKTQYFPSAPRVTSPRQERSMLSGLFGGGVMAWLLLAVTTSVSAQRIGPSTDLSVARVAEPVVTTSEITEASGPARADEEVAALLPPTTLAVAHVRRLDELVAYFLEHPLREKVEAIDAVQEGLQSDQYEQFQAVLQLAEFRVGMGWDEALSTLSGGGVSVAFDAQTQGVVVLAKSPSEEDLAELIDEAITFFKAVSPNADDLQETEYRGIDALEINEAIVARIGPWLLLSNNSKLAQSIADLHLDGGESLVGNERYRESVSARASAETAWAWVDIGMIRDSGTADNLFRDQTDDLFAEFLLGGLQDALNHTDFATLGITLEDNTLSLNLESPFDAEWIQQPREFFFGIDATGRAPAPLMPERTMLSAVTYRDIGGLWLSKEDLFAENVVAELSQADSQLSTLFAGVDFGEEVLGAAEPGFQLIVTRQTYEDIETPEPAIKIPSFALVFQLKDPDSVQRRFKVAYQSLVGFVNIGLGQQGQPQLEFNTEDVAGTRVTAATYFAEDDDEGRINYNFSPSISFPKDRFVLSSTVELARELTQMIQEGDAEQTTDTNTSLQINGPEVAQALIDNRDQLIAQNMLEEGNDFDSAAAEIDTILSLVEMFHSLSTHLAIDGETIRLNLDISVRP